MTSIAQTSEIPSQATAPAIDVFFDGGCPVCRLEVGYYRRIDRAGAVRWVDIESLNDSELPAGKSREMLLGRFHVRDRADGGWHVGVDAFARIWRALPVWRRFAFVFSVPGLRQLAEIGYRGFLRWQRWHRARRAG
jgi:predicted DCC family thiol-disulfide oxidoreductase YuxK